MRGESGATPKVTVAGDQIQGTTVSVEDLQVRIPADETAQAHTQKPVLRGGVAVPDVIATITDKGSRAGSLVGCGSTSGGIVAVDVIQPEENRNSSVTVVIGRGRTRRHLPTNQLGHAHCSHHRSNDVGICLGENPSTHAGARIDGIGVDQVSGSLIDMNLCLREARSLRHVD